MNCYLDSSVILRRLFGEPKPLKEWKEIKQGFSSRLLRLECFRTIDRLHLSHSLSHEETSLRLAGLHEILNHIGLLPITSGILQRAEQSMHTPLSTLDSLHLVTALAWKEKHGSDFIFATHDKELALAAKSNGLEVIGV